MSRHIFAEPKTFPARFFLACLVLACVVLVPLEPAYSSDRMKSGNGQIIREARCKILVRGPLNASVGDILNVSRRPDGRSGILGQARILKMTPTRVTASIVNGRNDCRRFLSAFLVIPSDSFNRKAGIEPSGGQKTSGPPPLLRGQLGVGPGLSNASLRGISREIVIEDYPLLLSQIEVSGEMYPFMFGKPSDGYKSIFGVEGSFRYVTSGKDVRVTVPAPGTGQELALDLAVKRIAGRGGLVVRAPLWANRLFADLRAGYLVSRFTTTINQLEGGGGEGTRPLELSPLRDLGLSSGFVLGGFQFHPVNAFRARLSAGTALGLDYQIDNRLQDAAANAPMVSTPAKTPSVFLLEAQLNYLIRKLQMGVHLSLENFSARALFPDGQSEGEILESYLNYGLQVSFLL